jgi:hypothetical protein
VQLRAVSGADPHAYACPNGTHAHSHGHHPDDHSHAHGNRHSDSDPATFEYAPSDYDASSERDSAAYFNSVWHAGPARGAPDRATGISNS